MMSAVKGAIVEVTMNTIGKKAKGLGHMVCINRAGGASPLYHLRWLAVTALNKNSLPFAPERCEAIPPSDITNAPSSRETPLLVVVV